MNIYIYIYIYTIERGIYQTTHRISELQPTLSLTCSPWSTYKFSAGGEKESRNPSHKKENEVEKGYGCFKSNFQQIRDRYSTGGVTINKCWLSKDEESYLKDPQAKKCL